MVDVGFDVARLAPPMRPIAMEATITGIFIAMNTTTEVSWPNFHVQKLLQVRLLWPMNCSK